MKKRIVALILTLIMLIGTVPVFAEDAITVYMSISKYGEIVETKDGDAFAYLPVKLKGKDEYTIDDAFLAAHTEYYEDGENGYQTEESDWGLSICKLWGDTSYNFGYQVNGGAESVMGPTHILEGGDYIDAAIYKNAYPDSESYSAFDTFKEEAFAGDEFTVYLSYVSGYDDDWNSVFSPCEGAKILINGEETDIETDENGEATIVLDEKGRNIISAVKTKELNGKTVPAITAPVCIVNVKASKEEQLIHNIAKKYKNSDLSASGGNLPWIICDMMVYEELFPRSNNIFDDDKKDEALYELINQAKKAERPGDLAKSILAIRALGYDASKVYTDDFLKIDLVEKLTTLIDNQDESVTNIYTLPYVIIALSQAEGYINEEQMEYLLNSALESKDEWMDVTYGTDALTPMLLALSESDSGVIEDGIEILKGEQREDGLIDGFEGYESASTGLAICALSAMGIDADDIKKDKESLIDGLVGTANEKLDSFPNAFATEQGLRGLLSWQLMKEKDKRMYDFSKYPLAEANVTGAKFCPVVFDVSPSNANYQIKGVSGISSKFYDLKEGEYEYTVSLSGYRSESGTFTVSKEDEEGREKKTISVSLSAIGGGGGGVSIKEDDEKEEKPEEEPKDEVTEEKPSLVLAEDTFKDVKKGDWFYDSVKFVYENGIFSGTPNGFEPNTNMSRAMIVSVLYRMSGDKKADAENPFTDVSKNAWYSNSLDWAFKNNIVSGVSDNEFNPDGFVTREQLSAILYRFAKYKGYDVSGIESVDISSYQDFEKVSGFAKESVKYALIKGVISGKTGNLIAPSDMATRAEVASMLKRFTEAEK